MIYLSQQKKSYITIVCYNGNEVIVIRVKQYFYIISICYYNNHDITYKYPSAIKISYDNYIQ